MFSYLTQKLALFPDVCFLLLTYQEFLYNIFLSSVLNSIHRICTAQQAIICSSDKLDMLEETQPGA